MNSDLMVIAAYLANWMERHDIPPRDVIVNLDARSARARDALAVAVLTDNIFSASALGQDIHDFVLGGVRFKL